MVSSIQCALKLMFHCIYACTHRLELSNQQRYLCLGHITIMYFSDIRGVDLINEGSFKANSEYHQ